MMNYDFVVCEQRGKIIGITGCHNNAKWYHEFLERSYLIEIQSKGRAYTWSNQRSEEEEICEKFDRVLSSPEWGFLFSKAIVVVDIALASDHAPIVLLANGTMKKIKKDFKFESGWILENDCADIVKEEWSPKEERNHRGTFRINLRRTRVKLWKWNREKFIKNKFLIHQYIQTVEALKLFCFVLFS
ncbi:hypothetical protein V6N12_040713 [Hibiscus sabdariffa]|uniref:Uncharacterized protein n=1 Tax=Hibiscus sabdariffa TaxID=183260 RepID=A0ABR2E6F8_9ROSI